MCWRKIEGFPNYSVSDGGEVRNDRTGKILKPFVTTVGYLQVILYNNGKGRHLFVHRLVAVAFVPNPRDLNEVNHKDGIKTRCCAINLEWCTHQENCIHRDRVLYKTPKVLTFQNRC